MNSYQKIGVSFGVGFLAYCLYFDYKRRSHPDYQARVRARRELERHEKELKDEVVPDLPPSHDKAALEKFFITEIETGEELIQAGDFDRAVKHLSYAVVLCPQPQQLLAYMKESLPASAYKKLVECLPAVNERVNEAFKKSSLTEDDVE